MNLKEKFQGDTVRLIPVDINRNEIFDAVEVVLNREGFSFADAHSWTYRDGEVIIEFYEGSMVVDIALDCYKGKYTIVADIHHLPGS